MIQGLLSTSRIVRALKKVLPPMPTLEESFFLRWTRGKNTKAGSALEGKIFSGKAVQLMLLVLVAGAVFFPRIPLGGIAGHYSFDLKIEDVLLIGLTSLFFMGQLNETISAPLYRVESCFILFLILCGFSIVAGIAMGVLDKPLVSLFYLVKWFEYFLVFALTVRLSRERETALLFLKSFFVIGVAVALYGYFEHFNPFSKGVYPNYYRLYERAPFHGDANHIGGLLAMWLAFFSRLYLREAPLLSLRVRRFFGGRGNPACEIASSATGGQVGLFTRQSDGRARNDKVKSTVGIDGQWTQWILLAAIFFVFFPFIWTFSRKSYFAFAGAYAFLFFLPGVSRRRWILLACMLICAGLLLPTRLAERVADLGAVLSSVDPYHSSWACNLDVWTKSFIHFEKFWVFGAGLGVRHRLFYESQYVMTLSETGVAGFSVFLLLLVIPAVYAWRGIKQSGVEGLIAGAWLGGWAAFLIHNLSCVSLTVSKLAIPWWFLTATVLGLLYPRGTKT